MTRITTQLSNKTRKIKEEIIYLHMGVDHLGREGQFKVLDLRGQVELVLGHPRRLAGKHEVQCGTQGKHIDSFVFGEVNGRVGEEQLRGHEGRGAAKGHLEENLSKECKIIHKQKEIQRHKVFYSNRWQNKTFLTPHRNAS